MLITIIEGSGSSNEIARILLLLGHRVNIIRQGETAESDNINELGANIIKGAGLDTDVFSKGSVSESDVFIALMDTDLDNLEVCLYIKNNFSNKKTITIVNNPGYVKKFERLGIDIAINSSCLLLNQSQVKMPVGETGGLYAVVCDIGP